MNTVNIVLKAIAVAMGVAVVVLSILNTLSNTTGTLMLGFGLAALAVAALQK